MQIEVVITLQVDSDDKLSEEQSAVAAKGAVENAD